MKRVFLFAVVLISTWASAQIPFSFSTGLSGLRNFSPDQKFWAIGQNVQANLHFSPRQTGYASLEYFSEGKFNNNFTASAKSILMTPQTVAFTASGRLTYRQLSLGLKHYFRGTFSERGINIYGTAGFGYLFARAANSATPLFDTTYYNSPVALGEGKIKRLTFDAGAGTEIHLGSTIYAFADVKTWLPASSQTSPYLHNNSRVPLTLIAGAGIRILFDFVY